MLKNSCPGRSPSATIPVSARQRNASPYVVVELAEELAPTTVVPSAESAYAPLFIAPPGRSPRPWKQGGDVHPTSNRTFAKSASPCAGLEGAPNMGHWAGP